MLPPSVITAGESGQASGCLKGEHEPSKPVNSPIVVVVTCGLLDRELPFSSNFAWGQMLRQVGVEFVISTEPLPSVIAICRTLAPSILLLHEDDLCGFDPCTFARDVEFGDLVKIVVFLKQESPDVAARLVNWGCSGCLPESASLQTIGRAIMAVWRGEFWLSRTVVSYLLRLHLQLEASHVTQRERDILSLVSKGYKNEQIAESLHISTQTVRWHLRQMYRKVGTHDRGQAARLVMAGAECSE